jgi:hypothetical protein
MHLQYFTRAPASFYESTVVEGALHLSCLVEGGSLFPVVKRFNG